jgi:hypothetical protein
LAGVWVHSPDKAGRDAGELAGVGPLGIAATGDAEALIALRPDCVVYAASGPERDAGAVPDYVRLLEAGINVVSTTSTGLIYPPAYVVAEWREQLEEAAKAGNASFYASGIFPGFATDELALLLSTQSKSIRTLTVTEVALNDHYPVASVMMDGLGFARPLDFEPMLKTPGFIEMTWSAPLHLIAAGLGVDRGRPGHPLRDDHGCRRGAWCGSRRDDVDGDARRQRRAVRRRRSRRTAQFARSPSHVAAPCLRVICGSTARSPSSRAPAGDWAANTRCCWPHGVPGWSSTISAGR